MKWRKELKQIKRFGNPRRWSLKQCMAVRLKAKREAKCMRKEAFKGIRPYP